MSLDLPRFFVPPAELVGTELQLAGEAANHLARVLRARVGDAFYALDGQGTCARVRITEVTRAAVQGRIEAREPAGGELAHPLELACALTRGEKFEWLLQKATELGVSRLRPVLTARTVVRLEGARAADKRQRWEAIAREAAEQCERGRVPVVDLPRPWSQVLAEVQGVQLVGLEREAAQPLGDWLGSHTPGAVTVWIGPEGGWTLEERAGLLTAGAIGISLGPRVLRAETAALAALARLAGWQEG